MKIKQIRDKSVEELGKDLVAFKKELFNLRFQKVQGQVTKTHRIRQLKKSVARSYTVLTEMKLNKHIAKPFSKTVATKEVKKTVKTQPVQVSKVKVIKEKTIAKKGVRSAKKSSKTKDNK